MRGVWIAVTGLTAVVALAGFGVKLGVESALGSSSAAAQAAGKGDVTVRWDDLSVWPFGLAVSVSNLRIEDRTAGVRFEAPFLRLGLLATATAPKLSLAHGPSGGAVEIAAASASALWLSAGSLDAMLSSPAKAATSVAALRLSVMGLSASEQADSRGAICAPGEPLHTFRPQRTLVGRASLAAGSAAIGSIWAGRLSSLALAGTTLEVARAESTAHPPQPFLGPESVAPCLAATEPALPLVAALEVGGFDLPALVRIIGQTPSGAPAKPLSPAVLGEILGASWFVKADGFGPKGGKDGLDGSGASFALDLTFDPEGKGPSHLATTLAGLAYTPSTPPAPGLASAAAALLARAKIASTRLSVHSESSYRPRPFAPGPATPPAAPTPEIVCGSGQTEASLDGLGSVRLDLELAGTACPSGADWVASAPDAPALAKMFEGLVGAGRPLPAEAARALLSVGLSKAALTLDLAPALAAAAKAAAGQSPGAAPPGRMASAILGSLLPVPVGTQEPAVDPAQLVALGQEMDAFAAAPGRFQVAIAAKPSFSALELAFLPRLTSPAAAKNIATGLAPWLRHPAPGTPRFSLSASHGPATFQSR